MKYEEKGIQTWSSRLQQLGTDGNIEACRVAADKEAKITQTPTALVSKTAIKRTKYASSTSDVSCVGKERAAKCVIGFLII